MLLRENAKTLITTPGGIPTSFLEEKVLVKTNHLKLEQTMKRSKKSMSGKIGQPSKEDLPPNRKPFTLPQDAGH